MADRIKAGVAGSGFIGTAHIEALRRAGVDVGRLGWKPPPNCAPKRQRSWASPPPMPRLTAMLADPQIQAVHITTPNFLHYPQVKAALTAGKHVVCEKPLTMKSSEAVELDKLAADKKLVNAVNHNIRFYPLAQQAHAMVKNGEIGDVYIIQGSYLQDWLLLDTDWNWRLEPELGGDMRAVADIGSHWLDLLTFISDLKITEVCADFRTFLPVRKKTQKGNGNLHRQAANCCGVR